MKHKIFRQSQDFKLWMYSKLVHYKSDELSQETIDAIEKRREKKQRGEVSKIHKAGRVNDYIKNRVYRVLPNGSVDTGQGTGVIQSQPGGMSGQGGVIQGQPTGGPGQAPGQTPGVTQGQPGGMSGQTPGVTQGQPGGMPGQGPGVTQGQPTGGPGQAPGQTPGVTQGQPGGMPGQGPGVIQGQPTGGPGQAPGQTPGVTQGQPGGMPGQTPGVIQGQPTGGPGQAPGQTPGVTQGQPGGAPGQGPGVTQGQPENATEDISVLKERLRQRIEQLSNFYNETATTYKNEIENLVFGEDNDKAAAMKFFMKKANGAGDIFNKGFDKANIALSSENPKAVIKGYSAFEKDTRKALLELDKAYNGALDFNKNYWGVRTANRFGRWVKGIFVKPVLPNSTLPPARPIGPGQNPEIIKRQNIEKFNLLYGEIYTLIQQLEAEIGSNQANIKRLLAANDISGAEALLLQANSKLITITGKAQEIGSIPEYPETSQQKQWVIAWVEGAGITIQKAAEEIRKAKEKLPETPEEKRMKEIHQEAAVRRQAIIKLIGSATTKIDSPSYANATDLIREMEGFKMEYDKFTDSAIILPLRHEMNGWIEALSKANEATRQFLEANRYYPHINNALAALKAEQEEGKEMNNALVGSLKINMRHLESLINNFNKLKTEVDGSIYKVQVFDAVNLYELSASMEKMHAEFVRMTESVKDIGKKPDTPPLPPEDPRREKEIARYRKLFGKTMVQAERVTDICTFVVELLDNHNYEMAEAKLAEATTLYNQAQLNFSAVIAEYEELKFLKLEANEKLNDASTSLLIAAETINNARRLKAAAEIVKNELMELDKQIDSYLTADNPQKFEKALEILAKMDRHIKDTERDFPNEYKCTADKIPYLQDMKDIYSDAQKRIADAETGTEPDYLKECRQYLSEAGSHYNKALNEIFANKNMVAANEAFNLGNVALMKADEFIGKQENIQSNKHVQQLSAEYLVMYELYQNIRRKLTDGIDSPETIDLSAECIKVITDTDHYLSDASNALDEGAVMIVETAYITALGSLNYLSKLIALQKELNPDDTAANTRLEADFQRLKALADEIEKGLINLRGEEPDEGDDDGDDTDTGGGGRGGRTRAGRPSITFNAPVTIIENKGAGAQIAAGGGKVDDQTGVTKLKGGFIVEGDTNIKGNRTEEGDTNIKGNRTEEGDTNIKGNRTEEGDTITKGTSTSEGDTMTKGTSTIEGDTEVKGNTSTEGDTDLKGDTATEGDTSVKGDTATEGDTEVKGDQAFEGDTTVKGDNATEGDTTVKGDTATEGDTSVKGDNATEGDTEVKGDQAFEGDTTVKGDTATEGDTSVKGDNATEGDTEVKGDQAFEGDTTVKGDNATEGDTEVKGDTATEGDTNVEGDTTVQGDQTFEGNTEVKGDTNISNTFRESTNKETNSRLVESLEQSKITNILESFTSDEKVKLLRHLDLNSQVKVVKSLSSDEQVNVMKRLDNDERINIFYNLDVADKTRIATALALIGISINVDVGLGKEAPELDDELPEEEEVAGIASEEEPDLDEGMEINLDDDFNQIKEAIDNFDNDEFWNDNGITEDHVAYIEGLLSDVGAKIDIDNVTDGRTLKLLSARLNTIKEGLQADEEINEEPIEDDVEGISEDTEVQDNINELTEKANSLGDALKDDNNNSLQNIDELNTKLDEFYENPQNLDQLHSEAKILLDHAQESFDAAKGQLEEFRDAVNKIQDLKSNAFELEELAYLQADLEDLLTQNENQLDDVRAKFSEAEEKWRKQDFQEGLEKELVEEDSEASVETSGRLAEWAELARTEHERLSHKINSIQDLLQNIFEDMEYVLENNGQEALNRNEKIGPAENSLKKAKEVYGELNNHYETSAKYHEEELVKKIQQIRDTDDNYSELSNLTQLLTESQALLKTIDADLLRANSRINDAVNAFNALS